MASSGFNVGDSVGVTGGAFDGRHGVITTAEVARQSPSAFVPRGIDESTGVWVELIIYGKTQILVLLSLDQLRLL